MIVSKKLVRGLAAAAFGVALLAGPAAAVVLEPEFADLRADLEHRVDNELAAPADKAAKKRRKAVDKCLRALAKVSTRVSTDAKTAGKCAGALARPFADEFAGAGKLDDFGNLFARLASDLTQIVTDDLAVLDARLAGLVGRTANKVRRQADKAASNAQAADALGTNYKQRFRKLAAAAKAVEKGLAQADKSVLKARAEPDQLIMTIDGERFVSDERQILTQFYTNDDGLRLFGRRARPDGGTDEIDIRIAPVPAPGRYALAEAQNVRITYTEKPAGSPDVVFRARTDRGVIVLDAADRSPALYSARFFFTLENEVLGVREVTNGASDARAGNILGGNILFL